MIIPPCVEKTRVDRVSVGKYTVKGYGKKILDVGTAGMVGGNYQRQVTQAEKGKGGW